MKRKAIAFLIGFLAPVIPAWGLVVYAYVYCHSNGHEMKGFATGLAMFYVGGPSILLGLLFALVATKCTRNKPDPLQCDKCGYSLVGLTSDKCPECGHTVSSTAPS